MTPNQLARSVIATIFLVAAGCASVTATNPSRRDFTNEKRFYVVEQERTTIQADIVQALGELGYIASTGDESHMPADSQVLVTFVSHPKWDLSMYEFELSISFADPKTRQVLATATSHHPSLTRTSVTNMVKECVAEMRKQANPAQPAE